MRASLCFVIIDTKDMYYRLFCWKLGIARDMLSIQWYSVYTVCVARCSSAVRHSNLGCSVSLCIGPANICTRYTDCIDVIALVQATNRNVYVYIKAVVLKLWIRVILAVTWHNPRDLVPYSRYLCICVISCPNENVMTYVRGQKCMLPQNCSVLYHQQNFET